MSDEQKLSERFAEAVDDLLADHEDDHEGWPHVVRQQRLANLVATNRDRILEALRLLAIYEKPSDEQARAIANAVRAECGAV